MKRNRKKHDNNQEIKPRCWYLCWNLDKFYCWKSV